MGKRYVGITIGPIVETIQSAKKMGQLWGGSYVFSYVAKNLIQSIKAQDLADDFILPYVESDKIFNQQNGVGLFPDRIIFTTSVEQPLEKLANIKKKALNNLADKIASELEISEKEKVEQQINNYFRINYLEKELTAKNPILELTPYLDTLELNSQISPQVKNNYLLDFLKNENVKYSFLAEDAFGSKLADKSEEGNGNNKVQSKAQQVVNSEKTDVRFNNEANKKADEKMEIKSIPEISLTGLEVKDEQGKQITKKDIKKEAEEKFSADDGSQGIYKKLEEEHEISIPQHKKYLAIVQADGDNVGKIVSSLPDIKENAEKDIKKYKDFSQNLFEYATAATEKIKNYGGFPIYAGGDDLLFFAPIVGAGGNIFDLLDDISELFNQNFEAEINDQDIEPNPSLSFGVSITYYKYPMYEALDQAAELLFGKAKNFSQQDKKKNAIAFRVLKHSGQYYGTTVRKPKRYDSDDQQEKLSYQKFKSLLANNNQEQSFLSALQYKIRNDKQIIEKVLQDDDLELQNYFANNFDEDIHLSEEKFLKDVQELLKTTAKEINIAQTERSPVDIVHSYLRFSQFLNEEGSSSA